MELTDLFDYENIISKVGIFTPIPIYATLLWINQSSIFYITLLVITIILSVIHIAIKREFFAKYNIKEDRKVIVFNKEFANKLKKEKVKPFLIRILFRYLIFINLGLSIIFGLLSLREGFNLLILILLIIAVSTFLLHITLVMLSMKAIKNLVRVIKGKKPIL